ncbi:MAG: TetR/AcrR family transcriptional regulator [Chloroflexota bacterium]|nr:TetR/AcrR family transcriptional regulator [Chloroflexota bacterium]
MESQVVTEGPEGKGTRSESLVQAAYRLIAERGFEGLRTRDIAKAVGINIATLHYYFPTKEALVRAVVAHAFTRFRSTLTPEGTATDQLRQHFGGLRRLSREEPDLFAVMGELALRAPRDPVIGSLMQATDDAWHGMMRTLLRRARAEGGIDAQIDPDDFAALVVVALRGTYLLPIASSHPERVDRALRQIERILGIVKPPRSR